jgi:DNA polymerase-3 subunit epsilon
VSWLGGVPLDEARWVVVDCETSGLDAQRDRLISAAAIPVERDRIAVARAFHAVIGQAEPSSHGNILVHGIGGEAQRGGRDAQEALRELSDLTGSATPVAFHAPFDAQFLRRAMRPFGLKMPSRWLDLATLAPALYPGRNAERKTLDEWLAQFSIECARRHDALADAFASAQLFLLLLSEAKRQGVKTLRALHALSRATRWIQP